MFGMTQDQFVGQLRQLLPQIGAIMTTLGFTAAATSLNTWAATILLIAGPAFQVGSMVWDFFSNSKKSIILSATQMPEVDSKALVAAIDDPTLKAVAATGAKGP